MKISSSPCKQVHLPSIIMSTLHHPSQIPLKQEPCITHFTAHVKHYHHHHQKHQNKTFKTYIQAYHHHDQDQNTNFISVNTTTNWHHIKNLNNNSNKKKNKVIFVMGATGTGKSDLSVALALHFDAEIINSDKMQLYHNLHITTNKLTTQAQRGVPHHLLGVILDPNSYFTASDFRRSAAQSLHSITTRHRLPIIAGGSNSFIEALVNDKDFDFRSNNDCLFIWLDVADHVLHSWVRTRVDRMVEAGLVDEVRIGIERGAKYDKGVWRAIGVAEMDAYLRLESIVDEETRGGLLENAIEKIKRNTCRLATRQAEKIRRLESECGWELHRLDATEVFEMSGERAAEAAWETVVARGIAAVERFLLEDCVRSPAPAPATIVPVVGGAVAATTY